MGGFTHLYLPRAAASSDPVERMKNVSISPARVVSDGAVESVGFRRGLTGPWSIQVVSCFVSAMTLTCGNFLKPLNPILGETLQVHCSKCLFPSDMKSFEFTPRRDQEERLS
eukprot:2530814-Rhodomonas_salina.4